MMRAERLRAALVYAEAFAFSLAQGDFGNAAEMESCIDALVGKWEQGRPTALTTTFRFVWPANVAKRAGGFARVRRVVRVANVAGGL